MAEDTPPKGAEGLGESQENAPRLAIQSQFVKDLSFENPRAPFSLQPQQRPEISVRVDVGAQPQGGDRYEVSLQLNIDAKAGSEALFVVELTYGGVFALMNIPEDRLQPLLLIECPRLLFPFARRIVADVTRDGGLPPLMIDPIDFVALYVRRQQAQAQTASQAQGSTPTPPVAPN